MKTRLLIVVLGLVLVLLVTAATLENSSLKLPRGLLGSGASASATGNLELRATLGQPAAGIVSSGNISLGQGFWHGGSLPITIIRIDTFLPLIQR